MDKHQRDEDDSEFGDGSYDDLYANASAQPIADSVPNSKESNSLNDNLHDTESRNGVKFYYFKFIYIVKLILEICSSRLQKKSRSLRLSKEDVEIVQATVLFL
jgi:predicted ATP-dependent endonuclease of OLD family